MKPYLGLRSKKQQHINDDDVQAVIDALNSNNLTQGPAVEQFELSLTSYCGASHAVAVSSATAALHLTCIALDLKRGDILWTTPNTFVASANCAYYCGADVDFVDIAENSYNLDVDKLEAKLIVAEKNGRLPKIVVPVHFSGLSADMLRINALAKKYGFFVIEDASHALGATYNHKKIGSCDYADAVIFSFHPVKMATTGEGGMVLTNNQSLADKIYYLRSHGVTRDPLKMQGPSDGPWYYQQIDLGYNYRITDMQAALGVSQMSRIDEFIKRRREIANFYDQALSVASINLPERKEIADSSWHLYVIRVPHVKSMEQKRQIFEAFWDHSVPVNVHYIPVHTQPYYQAKGFKPGDFPNAEGHYLEAFSLPIHLNLQQGELEHVVDVVKQLSVEPLKNAG